MASCGSNLAPKNSTCFQYAQIGSRRPKLVPKGAKIGSKNPKLLFSAAKNYQNCPNRPLGCGVKVGGLGVPKMSFYIKIGNSHATKDCQKCSKLRKIETPRKSLRLCSPNLEFGCSFCAQIGHSRADKNWRKSLGRPLGLRAGILTFRGPIFIILFKICR